MVGLRLQGRGAGQPRLVPQPEGTPEATIEVGDDTISVVASELTGAERSDKYAEQASLFPGFADYQAKTTRVIPVVALARA